MLYKKNNSRIDTQMANSSLQAILSECNMAPSSLPFDKIRLRQKVNTIFYNVCIILISFFLLLTILSPVFFHYVSNLESVKDDQKTTIGIVSYELTDGNLVLVLDTTVNPEKSYLTYNEEDILPTDYDNLTNTISFAIDNNDFSIHLEKDNGFCATVFYNEN